jgi:prepilin-type N-terminal cleavage/methylation domain-containing protein
MRGERGFSLVEVIVATGILVVALVSLAQLFTIAVGANLASRGTTDATVLAQQKIEELRALTWGFDAQGMPVSDTSTDTTVSPEQPSGGTGLSASPASSLAKDTPGFVDYIDRFGKRVRGPLNSLAGVMYTRRWAIDPLPDSPETLVIQVRVMRNPGDGDANRLRDEARLTTVKTRKPL